ncbi:MAG: hypothetical protein M3312_03605 [Actinomycetota bacterium]|nr:hypothetical protein [Actinomycetota bacterium]
MALGRRRFHDLVERQLELFLSENGALVRDCEAALRAYDAAERGEAEERYGEFLDLVETGQDELVDIRETYARTLDESVADEYRDAFDRLVRKRLPRFRLERE